MSLLSEIVNIAILKEKEAVKLYQKLYNEAKAAEVKQLAASLQKMEEEHINRLTYFLQNNEFKNLHMQGGELEKIKNNYTENEKSKEDKVQDMIKKAISEEDKAAVFYENIAATFSSYKAAQSLFSRLAAEEREHKAMFEQLLV
ncbi:MAG TPA: ferritin family protein [Spirochaetota bacterium]|nr:ferritin family protein [Spirochaetota bacterium]